MAQFPKPDDPIRPARIAQVMKVLINEGPWRAWAHLEHLSIWSYLNRIHEDRSMKQIDVLKNYPDFDHALLAGLRAIEGWADLARNFGDDRATALVAAVAELARLAPNELARFLEEMRARVEELKEFERAQEGQSS
jgi:hypothetical protein